MPVAQLLQLTFNQFIAYCSAMPEVMKLTSPWPTGDEKEAGGHTEPTSPREILALCARIGIPKKN